MNKARAYKELQRRQTKRLSELLMTLYAAERASAATGRLQLDATDCAVAAAAPAVLLVLGGGSGERGCSRLSGVSNGAAAAAVISYVATQLPRIGGGSGGGQPSQPPPPPPWALAPATGSFRPSTAAPLGRSTTAGVCGAAATAAPTVEAAVGRGLELQRGTRSAGRWRVRRFAGDGGGSVSNSARTQTSGGSSPGSSDPGNAAGDELPSSPDRLPAAVTPAPITATAPIFPTASQMRQLLSSLAAVDSRFGSGDYGDRARHLPRSAVHRRLGRCPADDGDFGHTTALLRQPSMAAEDCLAHPSSNSLASHSLSAGSPTASTSLAAASASQGRNSSRRSGAGGVAKQVSFVDPQPTQVQLVSPPSSPPGSPQPQPPWWLAHAEAAAAARRTTAAAAAAVAASSTPSVPALSEKNLQLHAAAMHAAAAGAAATRTASAVAAISAARRKKEPAAGSSDQPSCSLDDRTAAWIRERQVPQHTTGKPLAFSDIPEESDSERVDFVS